VEASAVNTGLYKPVELHACTLRRGRGICDLSVVKAGAVGDGLYPRDVHAQR
jgi:hypothetical protein